MDREVIRRWAPPIALVFAVLAVVTTPLSFVLYLSNRDHVSGIHYLYGDYTAGLLYPVVGAFLLRRRPDNRVGLIFAATSFVSVNAFAGQYAIAGRLVHHGSWPLTDFAAWIGAWAWAPELAVPALLPLLFPDGTLASQRWRPVQTAATTSVAVAVFGTAFSRHPIDATEAIYNPLALPHSTWLLVLTQVAVMTAFACSIAGLVSLVRRTRASQGVERAQLEWLMFSVLVTVVLAAIGLPLQGSATETLWALAMAAIPVGVVIAVLRYRLLDIELVLNRTIAYVLITGIVVIAYVVVVSAVSEVAAKKIGVAAVAIVALVVAAARDRIQRAVDRALFGHRRDPYAVVDRLGQRVDAAAGPVDALKQLAVELREALRLPSVAIVPDSAVVTAISTGTPVAGEIEVPITVHKKRIGVLRVGHRDHSERLRQEEQSVLLDTARRAGALLQAATLIADLRQSRERIVAAREEERRRLRRDLHDGVGPQLAGLALQLDTLSRRLSDDAENAPRVQMLRDRLRDTVVEVRRVVDNLRPPALDDVGLVEAVRQQVAAYGAAVPAALSVPRQNGGWPSTVPSGGDHIAGMVDVVAGPLPDLPAAVEVAAYRIVTEAVANAIRHGHPSHCDVTIAAADASLVLTVADDGSGIDADAAPGVGIASMRERAAEVAGTVELTSGPTGTIVTARLPLELT